LIWLRFVSFPLVLLGGLLVTCLLVLALTIALAYPNLPSLQALTEYQPKIPLRIYTAEGVQIGEFGEERRAVVAIADVPGALKNAIIAAEDERFYEHAGIDYVGVLRAAYANLVAGGRRQGASTITMQVARNFFLSSEKTLTRKLYEALLAFKIEHSLTKEQILELYVNQIYLGQRAYGFGAASQIYFGKALDKLDLAETAMLAGLPKAPSLYNPIANPQRAKQRQQYVLRRMHELGQITAAQYEEAVQATIRPRREVNEYSVHAEYAAEMVRQAIAEHYPDEVYSRGFRVYTTIRKADQEAAYVAMRKAVLEYDRRNGYRGPEGYSELPAKPDEETREHWRREVARWITRRGLQDEAGAAEAVDLFIHFGTSRVAAYTDREDTILILERDGRIRALGDTAEMTAVGHLGGAVARPYVCAPKDVDLGVPAALGAADG
jgi:penicillin-binding protein 1A